MLAAENGALPGGKVGGIGDVLRDLPLAFASRDWTVNVMTPSYGRFFKLPGSTFVTDIDVTFAGESSVVQVFQIASDTKGVTHFVLEHECFSPQGAGRVYCDDPASTPFATDASKFAFFCAAAAACIKQEVITPNVVHLHDWHTAMFLTLRAYDPNYVCLQQIRTVYTIHNLALQGIRPLSGHASAFASWFPYLNYSNDKIVDPRYHDCVNPMAIGIRLADHINTVSPTYALEILDRNDPTRGFHGGEGLELDLQMAAREERLEGILNGCAYDQERQRTPSWKALRVAFNAALEQWVSRTSHLRSSHYLALNKVAKKLTRKPSTLLVSIGRVTRQKVGLFLQATQSGNTALEEILSSLSAGELLVMLGSGDEKLTLQLTEISHRFDNFLFLEGYDNALPDLLYRAGDLFLMPSSFEPCGISQMFAMRAGQPCVVHGVGGLKDTVDHNHTGFVFEGAYPEEQAQSFVTCVRDALKVRTSSDDSWQTICDAAAAQRFSWDKAALCYEQAMYEDHDT